MSAATTWMAELSCEPVVVLSEDRRTGERKRVVVKKTAITLTRGREAIVFGVGKGAGGRPVITDRREQRTGGAALTNRGPLPGEAYCKPGAVRKLTPTAWATEVERLIGPAQIGAIFAGLIRAGFVG